MEQRRRARGTERGGGGGMQSKQKPEENTEDRWSADLTVGSVHKAGGGGAGSRRGGKVRILVRQR